jgi:hypothetical protein
MIKEAAEAVSGVHVAGAAGTAMYSLTSFPWSNVAAVLSVVLSLVYMWGALPRWWRTTVAFFHGVRTGDWSAWRKLGDQPMQEKED